MVNVDKLVLQINLRKNLVDVMLQVLDVVRHDKFQRKWPRSFDRDRVGEFWLIVPATELVIGRVLASSRAKRRLRDDIMAANIQDP